MTYIVQVNDVPSVYKSGHFPRKFKLLRDAKAAAQGAIDAGASMVRIEYPNGAELDFRPKCTCPASPCRVHSGKYEHKAAKPFGRRSVV